MPVAVSLTAVAIGRGMRYFGEGLLAVWYGEQAIDLSARARPDGGARRWPDRRCSWPAHCRPTCSWPELTQAAGKAAYNQSLAAQWSESQRRHPDPQRGAERSRSCYRELTDDARARGDARTRSSSIDDGSTDDSFAILARLQAARPAAAGDPLPAELRPDRGVRRRLRARARPAHRHLRRRSAERPARHSRDGRASSSSGYDIVCGWRKDRKDPFIIAPAAVDDRQPAHLVGDRRAAARLRLLAEGVPRRSRQAAEAVRRDAPVPARRSPASRASRSPSWSSTTARASTASRSTASRARSASCST